MSLERFHEAQAKRSAGYDTALAEIRAGGKRSHWIWYIFPKSKASVARRPRAPTRCGISARLAYLRNPILRARYEEIVAAVSEQLTHGIRVEDLMGGRTDALKLVSSLTLFRAAAEQLAREDPTFASLAQRLAALLRQTSGQGYPACNFTLARIIAPPAVVE